MSETAAAPSIARSTVWMASGTIASRILGLIRVSLSAWALIGTSAAANAWTNANTLPNIIYLLLAGGILNAVLVPQLTKAMGHLDGGRDYTDRLLTLAIAGLVGVTVVFTVAAGLMVKLYALTWTADKIELATAFAFICMPQIFFYGLYTLLGQILNSRDKFAEYAWAPVVANIVGIAGLVAFLMIMPHPEQGVAPDQWTPGMVWLLAGTATLGVVLQALVLLVPVWRTGFRWRPRFGFRGVGLRSASTVAMWTFGIIAVSQVGLYAMSNVINDASARGAGVAGRFAYEQANLLFILPHSLITVSLVTAMYPGMSRAVHAHNLSDLRGDLRHGIGMLGIFLVPVSMGAILLGPAITATVFLKSSTHDTNAIAYVMMAMLVGLVPYGVLTLLWRAFYAFEDGRTPFRLQVVTTVIAITGTLLSLLLPPAWIAVGVGGSQAAGQIVTTALAILWIRRHLGVLSLHSVVRTYVRLTIAALLGAAAAWLVHLGVAQVLTGRIGSILTLGVGGCVLLAVYVLAARRMRVPEMDELMTQATARARRLLARPANP